MKKYFLLLVAAVMFTSISFSQLRKLPAQVTDAFKNKYPQATSVAWKDMLSSFQASFVQDNEKYEATFNSKGEWKKTERIVEVAKLPEAVSKSIRTSKYADWTIKNALQIEEADGGLEYRILVDKSTLQKKYVYLNRDGQILKEVVTL